MLTKELRKFAKVFFAVWKINVKKISHYISGHTLHFPSNGRESAVCIIQKRHLNSLVKSPTFRILFRKSPAFTLTLVFICKHSIHSLKIFKKGKFWDMDLQAKIRGGGGGSCCSPTAFSVSTGLWSVFTPCIGHIGPYLVIDECMLDYVESPK